MIASMRQMTVSSPGRDPRPSLLADQCALSNRYQLGTTIGEGGFGKVKTAKHLATGEAVAVKIMDKTKLGDDFFRVAREISLLKDLNHPRICQLLEVIETPEKLYLVLEHCSGGELFDYMAQKSRLTEKEAIKYFRQILSGVAYLHHKGCSHRDLKPENIMLDEEKNIKIIDFGLAVRPPSGAQAWLETQCGSPTFVSPEVLSGSKYQGPPTDIWSLGIILYAFLTGKLPFNDMDQAKLFLKIQKGTYDIPVYVSPLAKSLLKEMLDINPAERISMSRLLKHPWVLQNYGLPVKWDFGDDTSLDSQIVNVMANAVGISNYEIQRSLSPKKYDQWTAAYLILKKRAVSRKPMRFLVPYRPVLPEKVYSENMPPPRRNFMADDPVREVALLSPSKRNYSQVSYDCVSEAESVDDDIPLMPAREETDAFKDPNIYLRKPTRPVSPPSTPQKATTYGMREALKSPMRIHEPPVAHRMKGRRSKSVDDRQKLVQEPAHGSAKDSPRLTGNRMQMKKAFGSLEKQLDKVVVRLTPLKTERKSTKYGRNLRIVSTSSGFNISALQQTDDRAIATDLEKVFAKCALDWKQKSNNMYKVRKCNNEGKIILKFSVELCWIKEKNSCGLCWKRLQGEAMAYAGLVKSILACLPNTDKRLNGKSAIATVPRRLNFNI